VEFWYNFKYCHAYLKGPISVIRCLLGFRMNPRVFQLDVSSQLYILLELNQVPRFGCSTNALIVSEFRDSILFNRHSFESPLEFSRGSTCTNNEVEFSCVQQGFGILLETRASLDKSYRLTLESFVILRFLCISWLFFRMPIVIIPVVNVNNYRPPFSGHWNRALVLFAKACIHSREFWCNLCT